MLAHLSLTRSVLLGLILATLIPAGVLTYLQLQSADTMMKEGQAETLRSAVREVTRALNEEAIAAKAIASTLAADETVKRLWKEGDRDGLLQYLTPYLEEFRAQQNVGQINLHAAPALPFLRTHKPERFGDDISARRLDVVEANTKKESRHGFSFGKLVGLGLRGIAPVSIDGEHLGVVDVGKTLSDGLADRVFSRLKQEAGIDVAVLNQKEGGFQVLKSTFDANAIDEANLQSAMAGETTETSFNLDGTPFAAKVAPILGITGEPLAVIVVGRDQTAYAADRQMSFLVALIVALGAAILAPTLGFLILRPSLTQLRRLSSATEAMAGGDTSVELELSGRKDEIGCLVEALNNLREQLASRLILESEKEQSQVAQTERQKQIDQLIATFKADVEGLIQLVDDHVKDMSGTADILQNTSAQAAGQVSVASNASEETSNNVETVAIAAEELSSSISEIGRQVEETGLVVTRATAVTKETDHKISSLADASAKIGDVIGLIQDIAEQTNLLALNATIEAARAGDAGKGFAVVASEVKALATQTAKATEEISQQINGIQTSTEEAVSSIADIARMVDDVNRFTNAISTAVEQQGSATAEISQNVAHAATATKSVATNVEGVQSDISQTREAANQVLDASSGVDRQVNHLRGSIDTFLRDVAAA
ncbi:MAG: methyl-accepting chemotaxis protein [Pseudomonadota bacterium]